jgi:aryl-alcohol dehydrogenase-like predicted oxidoreductase
LIFNRVRHQATLAPTLSISARRRSSVTDPFGALVRAPSLPENARKLQAVGELTKLAEEAGLSLPHLAVGFVLARPAVTSLIIGPRTMEHLDSLLTGADTVLSEDVLDRIDEIVPPGTDPNPADSYYVPPALADKALRRR